MAYYQSVLNVFGCRLLKSTDGKYYFKLTKRSKVRKLAGKKAEQPKTL